VAERIERPPAPDPAAAAARLEFAAYIARIAQIGDPGMSVEELRGAAVAALEGRDMSLRAPARMVLDALDAAAQGRP
jgi:hypothetical protein